MRSCGLAVTKTDRRILSLSFAPPKESDQRKGVRKRQPFLFFAYCALPFPAPKNRNGSRLFRVALAPIYNQNSAIVLYPGQNRGYWMATPPGWTWCCCPLPRAKPGLLDGQPSRLDLVLLSFTPGKTGAIGWPALQAGPGVIAHYPGQNRGYWMASPPGWTWCYCPLPRAKPGLLDDQPSGLVVLIAIIVTLGDTSATGKPGVISGLLTPEVSSSNSPGIAPGRWRPTTSTTPEGLTSQHSVRGSRLSV